MGGGGAGCFGEGGAILNNYVYVLNVINHKDLHANGKEDMSFSYPKMP